MKSFGLNRTLSKIFAFSSLAPNQLSRAVNFSQYLAGGRRVSGGSVAAEPASSEMLRAALAAGEKTTQEKPRALCENADLSPDERVSNTALDATMSSIEAVLGVNEVQAKLLNNMLLGVVFNEAERTADRLKAAQMLIEQSALSKKDRMRAKQITSPQTNIFNVLQTVKSAQDITRNAYEEVQDGDTVSGDDRKD